MRHPAGLKLRSTLLAGRQQAAQPPMTYADGAVSLAALAKIQKSTVRGLCATIAPSGLSSGNISRTSQPISPIAAHVETSLAPDLADRTPVSGSGRLCV